MLMHSATHTLHRQPALRSIPSPQQAMWILLARSARLVQLVEEGDERLFTGINNSSSPVLRGLLPPPSMVTQQYSLRRRPHDKQMPDQSHRTLGRQKFLNAVSKLVLTFLFILIVYSQVSAYAFCHVLIKK